MNTRILLIFASALALAAAGPQIAGRIEDSQGKAIAGARVRVYPAGAQSPTSTTSDKFGSFTLNVREAASYLLSAETNNLSLTSSLKLEAPAIDLVLRLEPNAQRTSIVVTADAVATSIDDSGKAFDVLDKESLSRRNEIFVLESLRNTPGMQVQQIGGPGATARIVTRGLRTADTSILIDGFRYRDTTSTQGDAGGLLSDLLIVNAAIGHALPAP